MIIKIGLTHENRINKNNKNQHQSATIYNQINNKIK